MNTSKHVKKGIRKQHKKELLAKSLADALQQASGNNYEKAGKNKGDEKNKRSSRNSNNGKVSGKKRSLDAVAKKQAELDALTPSAKKKKLRLERQAKKPNFSLVENMKEFWNSARVKNLTPGDREALIRGIMKNVSGCILKVTLRHDASRAVQCILQFGSEEQRHLILEEMRPRMYEIAKTPYGHFTVLKAISYCTSTAEQALIHKSLRGHFVSLGTNVIGARCCESVMQIFPKKLTKDLKAEFYGKKFISLMEDTPTSLQELIFAQNSKREPIMDHMRDLIQKFVDKGLLEFTYTHHLVWEYTQQCLLATCSAESSVSVDLKTNNLRRLNDLVALCCESAPKLLSTKSGAKTICVVITYSTAKDRKKLMKSLKGHVLESLMHCSAHLGILRLVDVTDDTVNVQKMLLDEIRGTRAIITYAANGEVMGNSYPQLISIAKHPQGCKLLLRLLAPEGKHLEPDEEQFFHQDGIVTSKKTPSARRQEHLAYLRKPLIQVCTRYAEELARCKNGSRVLMEVIRTYFPVKMMKKLMLLLSGQDVDEAYDDEDIGNEEDHSDSESEVKERIDVELNVDQGGLSPVERHDIDGTVLAVSKTAHKDEGKDQILNLEEDIISSKLFRKILELQANAEMTNTEGETAEWESYPSGKSTSGSVTFYPFAKYLAEALNDKGLMVSWIECNRSAFLLRDLMAVPSAKEVVLDALRGKSILNKLKKKAKEHAGGKCLYDAVSSVSLIK